MGVTKTLPNLDHVFVMYPTENVHYSVCILAWILADHLDSMVTRVLDAYSNGASQITLIAFLESLPGRLLLYN